MPLDEPVSGTGLLTHEMTMVASLCVKMSSTRTGKN